VGRQAVVSGGGTGIGAAVARALAEDGFQVVIVGRRASVLEATARELGDAVRPVVADLTSVPDVERLASTVDGQVDVLVNNAGGFDLDREDGLAGTADWWRRAYDMARDLGPHGATVNVIAPGYVAETEFFGGRLTEEGHATRVAETLVGRAGRPADIAAAVRYLAGPDSGYVTGQILSINGGIVFGR